MLTSEIAVIGGGLVGLATARALSRRHEVVVLEAEDRVAAHQSGHNSGVIHAGLYYRPGSLKSQLCTRGREALYQYCRDHGIPHKRCGKVVVATDEAEEQRLDELEQRGRANGLQLRRLDADGLREHEPHVGGRAGLFVPETGVCEFSGVARSLAEMLGRSGPGVRTGHRVQAVTRDGDGLVIETSAGAVRCVTVVNCAGLQSDRIAQLCGHRPGCRIVPVRGDYWMLNEPGASRVRHLIYPVPDPALPFLGVHLTRRATGEVEAGPSAYLVLNRHAYTHAWPDVRDALDVVRWQGAWRLAVRHWRIGAENLRRTLSRKASARALQRLVPELTAGDLRPGPCGIRAMAVERDGSMVDDFRIEREGRAIHVLNAPSPAATACLAIGQHVAGLVANSR